MRCALGCSHRWRLRRPRAQSVEQFYKGRTVTLIVGFAPGGINDISGRLVARHLGRFIPGQPTVVVQNLPGAGGLVTANRLFNVAENDGSVIAGLGRAVPQLAIQGHPNANFDPLKFTWLGSLSSYADDAYLMLVNAKHPAKSVADLGSPAIRSSSAPTGRREQSRLLAHRQGGARASMSISCAAIPAPRRFSSRCTTASSTAR